MQQLFLLERISNVQPRFDTSLMSRKANEEFLFDGPEAYADSIHMATGWLEYNCISYLVTLVSIQNNMQTFNCERRIMITPVYNTPLPSNHHTLSVIFSME